MLTPFGRPDGTLDGPAIYGGDAPAEKSVTTWSELEEQVETKVRLLRGAGVEAQTRVTVRAESLADQVRWVLAVWHAGAVAVLPHARLPREAAERQAKEVGASAFVDGDGRLARVSPAADDHFESYPIVDVMFSSGSSGPPKALGHTAEGHRQSALAVNEALGFGRGSAWAIDLPLSHVGGLCVLVRACVSGGAVVLPTAGTPAVAHPACTHVSAVPTQLHRALDANRLDAWAAKACVLVGGGAMAEGLARRLSESVCAQNLRTSYGMTELTSTIAIADAGEIGGPMRLLPHVQARVDAHRIFLRSPSIATRLRDKIAVESEPWFDTGDLGVLDATGRLCVFGRAGRMFIRGGENVTPESVERAFLAAGARTACVVDIPDEEWGAVGVAFVALEDGVVDGAAELETLRRRAAVALAPFERPAAVLRWPEGMSETKPKFGELRSIAAEEVALSSRTSDR